MWPKTSDRMCEEYPEDRQDRILEDAAANARDVLVS